MRAPIKTFSRARELRREMSLPEVVLWQALRKKRLAGLRVRRQHAIGPYILDFYCPDVKLAIELDGSGHGYRLRGTHDRTREQFLARQGIAVVRFWNHQVREELDSVLRAIWLILEKRSSSNPSPQSSPLSKGRGGL